MIIHAVVPLTRLSGHIGRDNAVVEGEHIGMKSIRLLVFKRDKYTCAHCSRTGDIFVVEKHHKSDYRFHVNLYSISPTGKYVLMTKDHIIPVSQGGRNLMHNLQTLCQKCNHAKGNRNFLPVLYRQAEFA